MVKNDVSQSIQKVIIKDITQETRNTALVTPKIARSTKNEIPKNKIEPKPTQIKPIRNDNIVI